jgi:hypothetical protein
MNKQIFLLLSFPFFCFCQTNKKSDLQKEGLLGNIKQVKQNYYAASEKFGELIQGDKKDSDTENYLKIYNEKGNKTDWFVYVKSTEKYQKHTYKYIDTLGKMEENLYRPDGSLDWKYIYKFDDKGNQIEESWYAPDGRLCKKSIYKYDDKNNGIETNHYNADGDLVCKYIYKNDDRGKQNEESKFSSGGFLFWKRIYKYDDKGLLIETNEYKTDGRLKLSITYKYDNKENQIEITEYKTDGNLEYRRTYTYEYDKVGNWIKRINKIGKEYSILIREITYY